MTISAPPATTRATRSDAYDEGREQRAPCGHLAPCGCSLPDRLIADCCFQCPLTKCRYDEGTRHQRAHERESTVIALNNDRVPRPDIAQKVGISLRRVHHYLQAPTHPEHN